MRTSIGRIVGILVLALVGPLGAPTVSSPALASPGAPVLQSLDPAEWNVHLEHSVRVAFVGENLTYEPVSVLFGNVPASSILIEAGRLTAAAPAISRPPGAATTEVPVTVTTPAGSSVLANAFTYRWTPILTGLSSTSWNTNTERRPSIELLTENVRPSDTVQVTFDGVTATRVADQRGHITVQVPDLPRQGTRRTVSVQLTTSEGTSTLPHSFTYVWGPVLTSASPTTWNTRVERRGRVDLAVENIRPADVLSVEFGGSEGQIVDARVGRITVNAPERAPRGARETVTIALRTRNGTVSLRNAFTYVYGPVIESLDPAVWYTHIERTRSVRMNVDNIRNRDDVTVLVGGHAARVTDVGAGRITFQAPTIATTRARQAFDVTLRAPHGNVTLKEAFTYVNGPVLESLSPNSWDTSLQHDVPVALGTRNVRPSDKIRVTFGGVAARRLPDANGHAVFEAPALPANGLQQTVDVVLTTDAGSSRLANAFTYHWPAAPTVTVSSVSPTSGCTNCGTAVTITGAGFGAGVTGVWFGDAVASFVPESDSVIRASAPFNAEGVVAVTVATANGARATLPAAFTYLAPAPAAAPTPVAGLALSGLSPNAMTSAQALVHPTVTLSGTALTTLPPSGGLAFTRGAARYDVYSYTIVNATTITLTLPTLPSGAGVYDLVATGTAGSATLASALTVS